MIQVEKFSLMIPLRCWLQIYDFILKSLYLKVDSIGAKIIEIEPNLT